MKKATLLFALLLVLSVGGVLAAGTAIYDTSDDVQLTETVLYGNPESANGLHFDLNTALYPHLFWTTHVSFPMDGPPDTDFSYLAGSSGQQPRHPSPLLQMKTSKLPPNRDSDSAPTGMDKALQELFDKTALGESRSETVHLSDYLEYYPLELDVDLPDGIGSFHQSKDMAYPETDQEAVAAFQAAMEAYFKIPILKDETVELSVEKNADGTQKSMGCSSADSDSYALFPTSARIGNTLYFVISGTSRHGTIMDFGQLPEGFGIFALPLLAVDTDNAGQPLYAPQADQLDMVYALKPSTDICGLRSSPDGRQLILETLKDGILTMTVLEADSMSVVQSLELGPCTFFQQVEDHGDFLVYLLSADDCPRFYVLTRDEAGRCTVSMTGEANPTDLEEFSLFYGTCSYAYDGQRLAVLNTTPHQIEPGTDFYRFSSLNCGFLLGVYDRSGLCYYGSYDNSLQTTTDHTYRDEFPGCTPSDAPILFQFKS